MAKTEIGTPITPRREDEKGAGTVTPKREDENGTVTLTFKVDAAALHAALLEDGLKNVTRFEVIDENGRAYFRGPPYGPAVELELSAQDDGRTLKVFVRQRLKTETNDDKVAAAERRAAEPVLAYGARIAETVRAVQAKHPPPYRLERDGACAKLRDWNHALVLSVPDSQHEIVAALMRIMREKPPTLSFP